MTTTTARIPSQARIVIIGGGIIGTSIAYHLGKRGCRDVILLERDRLTSGTTWHAAGLMVTFGSMSSINTWMRRYSRDLYSRLEAETGLSTGFKPVGFIELATDRERLEEYRRICAFNRYCGVEVEEISASEVGRLFPLARTDDILAGYYVAGDGRVNPIDVTMSMAKGARMAGVQIVENVSALRVVTERGEVRGVETTEGLISCEKVINCAGMWARQLGDLHGVNIPNQSAEHYYLITEPIKGLESTPVLEDPSSHAYYRDEQGGLMIGLFEPVCAPWKLDRAPQDFSFGEIPPDWERMTPYLTKAMSRVPVSETAGLRLLFCGPESFTPDLKPIIGEAPEIKNYFVAAGLNSIGIILGGGLGKLMADWLDQGFPGFDVTGFHVDRLHGYQNNIEYRRQRTVESLGLVYRHHFPTRTPETARQAERSPLHQRLEAARACFRDVSGWEAPDWFAPHGVEPAVERLSWGRQNWFPYWKAEHDACRTGVCLFDMSFMSKFLVQGRDAGDFLDRLSVNSVNGDVGRITYTQWLNERGTLEADLTVTKYSPDRFLVVVTDTMHRHTESWMKRNIRENEFVTVTDVTSGYAQINIQGPRSRELLQQSTSVDLSNEGFPFRTAREIDIALARVVCVRITYVGELGYELYVPAEQAVCVYDAIVREGRAFALQHAGLKALASLRHEKGYRDYGHDMDNTDHLDEVGLGFCAELKKPVAFVGREALEASRKKGTPHRRLLNVLVNDPSPLLYHAEVLYRDSVAVGEIRCGSYGHTLGGAIALAMVEADHPVTQPWIDSGCWEVDIAGTRHGVRVSLKPFYDPENKRIKA